MIRVVDDFLNAAYYKGLENTVLTSFNWGFNVSISGYDVLEDSGLFGFSHSIFDAGISASPFYQFLIPFLLQSSEAGYIWRHDLFLIRNQLLFGHSSLRLRDQLSKYLQFPRTDATQ